MPEAGRRELIRRLTFDLIGLPPAPEEVDLFVRDRSEDAYERLVDRLLASPQYGVRWARWWLDLARYGESNGFEYDEFRPSSWRYRDWVVGAFNRDMPYDEFARLQIAGDVLRPEDAGGVEATGFLVAGAYDTAGQNQVSAGDAGRRAGRRARRPGRHRLADLPRADGPLRPLSRSQVRPDPPGGVLPVRLGPGGRASRRAST